jgi:hypothetical protein
MNKEEVLQRLEEEQLQRRKELYMLMDKCSNAFFVRLSEDIRWWNKYIRYIENNY